MDPFEFADIAVGMLHRESETGSSEERTAVGIPQKVSGFAETDSADGYVMVDLGGSSVTEDDLQAVEMPTDVPVKAGDEVSVEIVDGKPRVVGRIGWGDALQTIADDAYSVATATNQHFWADGNGAHVSTDASDPEGASNSLWNSLGLLIRKATNYLVSITSSAIAFYDGLGNGASNINASFGSSGFQVGQDNGSHLIGDYHSLQLADKEGSTYFYVSDLRDSYGIASIVDSYVGDGSTTQFSLSLTATSTGYTVEVNGTAVTIGITKTTSSVTFATAPARGDAVSITYDTASQGAKAYTLGVRGAGNVGARSTVVGTGTASGGNSFSANSGKAKGYMSSAFGNSTAAGDTSHAEGELTQANARGSHSEGLNSRANGQFSHAEGYQTIASSQYQHVFGKNNREDSADTYVEIVGNGPSDGVRLNARTLDWSGNEVLAGTSTADSHNGFAGRATLASTDSIDAIYRTGVYYVTGNSAQGTHPPFGSTYYSILSMGSGTETANDWVGKQIAVGGAGDVATRSYSGNPRAWSAWANVVSDSVNVGNPTLNSNATATTFQTRRVGNIVNLSVYQLKVSASLADGSSVSLGTGIIGANARPTNVVYMPLMANVSGKGAGVFLYITSAGNVTLYNRSGSSLGTGTNLAGNTSWVI